MFLIRQSTDDNQIGEFPQCDLISPTTTDRFDSLSLYHKKPIEPGFNPHPLRLNKKAKFTDLLSTPVTIFPHQIILSRQFFELLVTVIGPRFSSTPIKVYDQKGTVHEYILVNFHEILPVDIIQMDQCWFSSYSYQTHQYTDFQISNYAEYLRLKSQQPFSLSKLSFSDLLQKEYSTYEHFVLPIETNYWIANKSFVQLLKQNNITGIQAYKFGPKDNIDIHYIRKLERVL